MSASNNTSKILATSQQTRFYINENDASREIDFKSVAISIVSDNKTGSSGTLTTKSRAKVKADSQEILTNAHLRVKSGIHYGFVGRNGTDKSTILRALADKLIPGLHKMNLRIAALQQVGEGEEIRPQQDQPSRTSSSLTVLEMVVKGDPYRNTVEADSEAFSRAINSSDPLLPVKTYRQHQLSLGKLDLVEVQKEASLRSGARGFDVRKRLLPEHEQRVDELQRRYDQVCSAASEIQASEIEADTQQALLLHGELQAKLDDLGRVQDLESKAKQVLTGLGFKEKQWTQTYGNLSGGWKMRCMLAATLVRKADLLILDEPTNYLDLLGILWLQSYLIDMEISAPDTAVIVVSHDRDFINATCSELIMLRDKDLSYFQGNLDSYDKSTRREILRLTRMKDAKDKQRSHMEKTIAENMKQGKKSGDDNKIRQAKSRQHKLDDRMGLEVSAKGTRFKLNRDLPGYHADGKRAAIEIPKTEATIKMLFPPAPDLRFPGSLLSLENASLKYKSAAKPTLEGVNIVVHPGDRIGIVGLNGAGKSTLVQMLLGKLPLSSGTMASHPRLKVGYYSQHAVDVLVQAAKAEPSRTPLGYVLQLATESTNVSMDEGESRKLLGSMGLPGRTASDTPIMKLSGGQLVRLALSIMLMDPPHVFVLDEPTTHLDFATVDALAGALKAYDGAIVLVTHDRFFVRTVVEGQPMLKGGDDNGSDSDEDEDEDNENGVERRRIVYEVRASKAIKKEGGMGDWETALEKRLQKLQIT
ncbi:ABC transporter [Polychaeton citri CBS 116435]|uniref:ABC transporter n=1 Tax=Polychaeton citri CBS 116435 TaxID=1314669 RepID=A0A9P4Q5Q8_9PEZI|nr:ABC transporter [Polychaeton citri CBS 116435]